MTGTFVSLRRIAALSVAVTLVATPIALAQTPASASPNDAPTGAVLLSPTAFARLVQPRPAEVASAPVVKDPPRIDLLHQGRAAVAHEAQAAPPAKAPQQKNWWGRNKWYVLGPAIGAGAFFGVWGLLWAFSEGG